MDAAITVLQSLQEVAVVEFRFAKAAKGRRLPVGARAGPSNGVAAGAQLLQHLFAIPLLFSSRVGEGAPQETYCQYQQGSLHRRFRYCAGCFVFPTSQQVCLRARKLLKKGRGPVLREGSGPLTKTGTAPLPAARLL